MAARNRLRDLWRDIKSECEMFTAFELKEELLKWSKDHMLPLAVEVMRRKKDELAAR